MTDQSTPSVANANLFDYWNGNHGDKWVAHRDTFDGMIASHGRAAMVAADINPGKRVIDVGCGFGSTTLEIADMVGSAGQTLGIDFSGPMIAAARARIASRGADDPPIDFIQADVQTHDFAPASADILFSRYGVMFFDDPVTAFANLHTSLAQDGGRLAFVCWRTPQENTWMSGPMGIARDFVELAPPPPAGTPGIFAFADKDRIAQILNQAGFRDIAITALDLSVNVGPNIEAAADNAITLAPWAAVLADVAPETVAEIKARIIERFGSFVGPKGVEIPSASWLVHATG